MFPRFLWFVPEAWTPNLGVLRPKLQRGLDPNSRVLRPKCELEMSPLAPTTGERLPGVAEPWDHLRGAERFCAIRNKDRLNQECIDSAIESWGPNCATFSRARERPIPGVTNAPKPLRSIAKPEALITSCSCPTTPDPESGSNVTLSWLT
jgi:hypothetical protein